MNRYRRAVVLSIIDQLGEATALDVKRELENRGERVNIHLIRMLLRNYYRGYLLRRRRGLGSYVYSLTKRGHDRLNYFRREGFL